MYAEETSSGRKSGLRTFEVLPSSPPPILDLIEPTRLTATGQDMAEEFRLAASGKNFVLGSFVRIRYAKDGIYAGAQRRAGELAGTIPSDVIQSSAVAMLIPLRLAAGDYEVLVVNPHGQTSGPGRLVVGVQGPTGGFTISADITSRTITQGQSTTFTLSVQSTDGFNLPVSVAAINLPPGNAVAFWTQETVTPPANGTTSTTLTINTNSSTATGSHMVTLRASRTGFPTREIPVTVTITPASTGGSQWTQPTGRSPWVRALPSRWPCRARVGSICQ